AEARAVQRGNRAHPEVRANSLLVLEGEEDVVLHLGTRTARVQLGVHPPGVAEQEARLVHEVRAQVEQQSASLCGVAELAPAGSVYLRTEALEARLEAGDRTEL